MKLKHRTVKSLLLAAVSFFETTQPLFGEETQSNRYLQDRLLIGPGMNTGWANGDLLEAILCIKQDKYDEGSASFTWWGASSMYRVLTGDVEILQSGRNANLQLDTNFPIIGLTATYNINGIDQELKSEIVACNINGQGSCPDGDNTKFESNSEITLCRNIIKNEATDTSLYTSAITREFFDYNLNVNDYNLDVNNELKIRLIQLYLHALGYNPGKIDGIMGQKTENELKKFFHENSLPYSYSEEEIDAYLDELQIKRYVLEQAEDQVYNIELKPMNEISVITYPDLATDATFTQSLSVFDAFEKGRNDIYLCDGTAGNWVDTPVVVLSLENDTLINNTENIFGDDVPTTSQCTKVIFSDLNSDGLSDVVYSDATMDYLPNDAPLTAKTIEFALNRGNFFERITQVVESEIWGIRSYATAAGDIDGDSFGEILLSSGLDASQSKVIDFNEGQIEIRTNPFVERDMWGDASNASTLQVADFDLDGEEDLYIGGQQISPNNRIAWSGLSANSFSLLPETVIGNQSAIYFGKPQILTGADMVSTAIADFDNDGDPDIFNIFEEIHSLQTEKGIVKLFYGGSQLQVIENIGGRNFVNRKIAMKSNMGDRYYLSPIIYDLNNDGLLDIIANYWNKEVNWSTWANHGFVIFMNLGDLEFQKIDSLYVSGGLEFSGTDVQDKNTILGNYNPDRRKGLLFPLERRGDKILVAIVQPYSDPGGSRRLENYLAELQIE